MATAGLPEIAIMELMGNDSTSPTLSEKLRKLLKGRKTTQAAVADAVGVTPQAMSRYVAYGAAPRPETALKLASYFGVDVGWLFDESQPWVEPPPTPGSTLSDADLMTEVSRRYEHAAMRLLDYIEQIEEADWEAVKHALEAHKAGEPLPQEIRKLCDLAGFIGGLVEITIDRFDPWEFLSRNTGVRRSDVPLADLRRRELEERLEAAIKKNVGAMDVNFYLMALRLGRALEMRERNPSSK